MVLDLGIIFEREKSCCCLVVLSMRRILSDIRLCELGLARLGLLAKL
jgi:hypothetical protein